MEANNPPEEFSREELKRTMDLPATVKLQHLENMNKFLAKAMSPKARRAWTILKQQGW